MREIKFRALTIEGKVIKDVGKIEFFEDGSIIINDEIPVEKLIQYTGLKDKNSKEIYEGDILEMDKTARPDFIWRDKPFTVEIPDIYYFFERQVLGNELNIIGNIYENSELIKEAT